MNVVSSKKMVLARVAVPIAAMALLATACSSSLSSSSAATAGGKAAAAVTVKVERGPLGRYLVDGSRRALYLFGSDTDSKSSCAAACAAAWPPLVAKGSVTAAGGASATDITEIDRPDGAKQVTYAGHPLYYYVGDGQPGSTGGQGVNDFGALWWLVSASGQKITTPAPMSGASSNGGGSY